MTSFLSRLALAAPAVAALALPLVAAPAVAQDPAPKSKFWRQMEHVDLGLQGMGIFTKTVSGPVTASGAFNIGNTLQETGSSTVGPLGTLRYTPKPYVGVEFNYGEARYTVNFTTLAIASNNSTASNYALQVQTQYNEFTLGYVVTPPHPILGLQPYASAGAGTIYFKPTKGGGDEEPKQPRAVYYYNLGLQKEVYGEHFGLRAGWRQTFYLAPDFLTNYQTILQRTSTKEPYAGFYLKF